MKQVIVSLIQTAVRQKYGLTPDFTVEQPPAGRGDYATNVAFVLAKPLRQNPAIIAVDLIAAITAEDAESIIGDLETAGGFINLRLSDDFLAKYIAGLRQEIKLPQLGINESGQPRKVIFEYSSPNTNKPLHIGHTRNNVYGRACINLLKAVGYNVIACEIINDRGVHIMKSMLMYMKHGHGETPESAAMKPDHFVGKYYRMFGEQAAESLEKEQQLMAEAQDLLRQWESGDNAIREVWQKMNQWFFDGIKQTYEKEGTFFDEVDFESQIYDKGREIVLEGVAKGIFQKEKDGSVSIDLEEEGLGKKYLLRKDGTTLYMTQDLYLWHLRNQKHSPDMAIVTTAAEQAYHFQVLKYLFKLVGFPWADKFQHLPYEHVYLGENKLSARGGNTISADDLLVTIKERVRAVMASSLRVKSSMDNDTLVEAVAYGAIKYGYLKYEPQTRIYFDIDQTISIEGNTGPYIQYAHARIRSIITKAGTVKPVPGCGWSEPPEKKLVRHLLYYADIAVAAAQEYKPSILASYLHELASAFNYFYSEVPVLNADSPELASQRLQLVQAVGNVLAHGLALLGIEAPEEM